MFKFFPTALGGRQGPTSADRYACIFEVDNEYFDCRLLLDDVGPIWPGSHARVPIKFLFSELIMPNLSIGKEFYLKEIRRIGRGVIQALS